MDAYKIAVSLSMTSNAAQVLQVLSSKLLGVHAQVNQLQGGLNRLKVAIGGAFAVGGAFKGLEVMGKMVLHGNELVKIQRDMGQAGVTGVQVQEAYAKAWQMTSKYQNMSAVDVMKMINDARMTFGDQDSATHHIEDFVQMASFLKSYQGGKHAMNSEGLMREVNAAMKSGEIAGKITPEDMAEHVKQLTAMKIAYGEQLKISQYLTAQRAGGVALRNTSDEFRYGMFPALVQENGPGAGVMLMTAFNKIVAGVGNRTKSLEQMANLGLLKKSQLDYDKIGHVKGLKDPSAIMNNREAAINFGSWVMTTLKPLLDKQTSDPIRQAQLISAMFPDRNAAKAVTEVIQQYTKLAKDAEQMHKARLAMNTTSYNDGSLDYQIGSFKDQWKNLLDALGAPMVAKATDALAKINAVLSQFGQWAKDSGNAETIRKYGEAIAWFLGGTLVAGATALLFALGPIPLAIGAVSGAFGYMATHLEELGFIANKKEGMGGIGSDRAASERAQREYENSWAYKIGRMFDGGAKVPDKSGVDATGEGPSSDWSAKIWNWVKAADEEGSRAVGTIVSGWTNSFKSAFANFDVVGDFKQGWQNTIEEFNGIKAAINKLGGAGWEAVKQGAGFVMIAIESLVDAGWSRVQSGVDAVKGALDGFVSFLSSIPSKIAAAAKSMIPSWLGGGPAAPATGGASGSWGAKPAVPNLGSAGASGSWGPQKQTMNVPPPPRASQPVHVNTAINMDGRKIAEAVTHHQVAGMSGPSQGAPYFDSTRGSEPLDYALA